MPRNALAALLLLMPVAAHAASAHAASTSAASTPAACTAPTPPPASEKPQKPALPQKPACLDAKGGCPGWEAYTYNDGIKAYNAQLGPFRTSAEAYARKLKAYADGSVAYANCEMQSLQ